MVKQRRSKKPETSPSSDRLAIQSFAGDEHGMRDEGPRKRYFDVDEIIEKSTQAHLNRSIAFERLSEALGTRDPDFVWGLTAQIIDAVGVYHSGEAIGFVLSVIKNKKPSDHIAAMVVAQMAVAHLAMMRFADEMSPRTTTDPARWEFALKALNSFPRTFATQMSALKQYCSGGEQRVTVQHVSVSDRAQAIVGNVNNSPQRAIDNASNAPAKLRDARRPAMAPIEERDPIRVGSKRSDE
jgi:hypothetical protein